MQKVGWKFDSDLYGIPNHMLISRQMGNTYQIFRKTSVSCIRFLNKFLQDDITLKMSPNMIQFFGVYYYLNISEEHSASGKHSERISGEWDKQKHMKFSVIWPNPQRSRKPILQAVFCIISLNWGFYQSWFEITPVYTDDSQIWWKR